MAPESWRCFEAGVRTGAARPHTGWGALAAAHLGDFEGLLRVLDPEVKLAVDTPDGVVVILGPTKVAAGGLRQDTTG